MDGQNLIERCKPSSKRLFQLLVTTYEGTDVSFKELQHGIDTDLGTALKDLVDTIWPLPPGVVRRGQLYTYTLPVGTAEAAALLCWKKTLRDSLRVAIRRGSDTWVDRWAARSGAIRGNLPAPANSFIGREGETAELKTLLARTRLLTVTGTGGIGKTRLTLEVARSLCDDYADGIWLVELAAAPASMPLEQFVAGTLGLREEAVGSLRRSLSAYIMPKALLLLLDNCEHLASPCASLVAFFLRECPRLKVLATSREPLHIDGEQVYQLSPLSVPDPRRVAAVESIGEYDAVRLFIERATQSKHDFSARDELLPIIANICIRLDGLPLAIELAAARVRSLSIQEINLLLDRRFHLLTGGHQSPTDRQRTLLSTIDWSYRLLADLERLLLCRLCVFAGGWTLDAAETVCSGEGIEPWAVLNMLTSLVDKSLVVAETLAEPGRYHLLETVRQYGRDRLAEIGQEESLRRRHFEWFLALARLASANESSAEAGGWLDRLDQEHANLREAAEWCVQAGQVESGLELAYELVHFWAWRGYQAEGRSCLRRLLYQPGASTSLSDRVFIKMAASRLYDGDGTDVTDMLQSVLERSRDAQDLRRIADTLGSLGSTAFWRKDYEQALAMLEQSRACYGQIGDREADAWQETMLGRIGLQQRDLPRAQALLGPALDTFRGLSHHEGIGWTALLLGQVSEMAGDGARAEAYLEESLAAFGTLADLVGQGWALLYLGRLDRCRRQYAGARDHLDRSLQIWRALQEPHRDCIAWCYKEIGMLDRAEGRFHDAHLRLVASLDLWLGERKPDFWQALHIIQQLGVLAAAQGESARAVRLFAAAEAIAHGRQMTLEDMAAELESLRGMLGSLEFDKQWGQGQTMDLERVVGEARR
jgi:non-specific serine/threonine protein kinase